MRFLFVFVGVQVDYLFRWSLEPFESDAKKTTARMNAWIWNSPTNANALRRRWDFFATVEKAVMDR